ncbi:enhanced intracellular survival protein Eis [Thalassobacillus sp. CUG 92003]|uniref:GNAT family N-acetyltransferase n=1 Tax=Thalassobacillus sp. CUG 92003 TaxID=2736641 RepID=UPI0015E6EAAB|nr:GNAT family N-acetyltransferase [Thalassobacillus sp. CUG 92003]
MKIVPIGPNHYRDAVHLSAYAFQSPLTEETITEKMKRYETESLYGIFAENQLAAKLHIRPFSIWMYQQNVMMGGVASIATYPEHRRMGFVKALLIHALKEMKDNGQWISVLHPFSIPFYRKYGWELFSHYKKMSLNQTDLQPKARTPGYIKRFTKDAFNDHVEEIYRDYSQQMIGMFDRPTAWWRNNVLDRSIGAVYYGDDHQPLGYIIYSIGEERMVIPEFVPLNHEAREGLWNFICQHDSMVTEVDISLHAEDPLLYTLEDPEQPVTYHLYGMVRIVDAKSFLDMFPFQWKHANERLRFHLRDEYAPWNNGTFQMDPPRHNNQEKQDVIDVTLTINSLSTLLLGYMRPKELTALNLLDINEQDVSRLEHLIPHDQPNFLDFF